MKSIWLLSFIIPVLARQYDCRVKLDQTTYDLSSLYRSDAEGDYYSQDAAGYVYHMNLCGPVHTGGDCSRKNGTLCQYEAKDRNTDNGKNVSGLRFISMIASTDETPKWEFISANNPDAGVRLRFAKQGDTCKINNITQPREVVMEFSCSKTQNASPRFTISESSGICHYALSYSTLEACPRSQLPSPIEAGKVYSLSVAKKEWHFSTVNVLGNTADLLIKITQTGANESNYGDPDLYVRKGSYPTLSVHDYRATHSGKHEQVSIRKSNKDKPLTPGSYVIGVYGFGARSVNYDLQAFLFDCPGNCSQHGQCINGKCQCDEGYNVDLNDDCSAQVQEVSLGQLVQGSFEEDSLLTYFRFNVNDTDVFQLQVNVAWSDTYISSALAVAKGRFPTLADNDGRDNEYYGGDGTLQVSVSQENVSPGVWIAALFDQIPIIAKSAKSYNFTVITSDCPSGCSGHGQCNKVTHNCTCDTGFTGKNTALEDCALETKILDGTDSLTADLRPWTSEYFSVEVTAEKADHQHELLVSVTCKNNGSEPQSFMSYGQLPTSYNHDFVSPLPRSQISTITVSSYSLKKGFYYLYVPNRRYKNITVSVTATFRPINSGSGSSSDPASDEGHSTGTVVGYSILFLLIGGAIGYVVQTKRAGGQRRHRMIDDGINSDGSYDPPMMGDNQYSLN